MKETNILNNLRRENTASRWHKYQTGLYMLSKSEYIGLFMNILTFMS